MGLSRAVQNELCSMIPGRRISISFLQSQVGAVQAQAPTQFSSCEPGYPGQETNHAHNVANLVRAPRKVAVIEDQARHDTHLRL
nr:unnamed protein product [Digitaria exilis]